MVVSRNEKQKMLSEFANKYYQGKMSRIQFEMACNEIKEIPLDFSCYPRITDETGKIINAHVREEDTEKNGNVLWRGGYMSGMEYIEKYLFALKCNDRHHGDAVAGFAGNREELFIFGWCEGDTTITPCKTLEDYEREMHDQINWWIDTYG